MGVDVLVENLKFQQSNVTLSANPFANTFCGSQDSQTIENFSMQTFHTVQFS